MNARVPRITIAAVGSLREPFQKEAFDACARSLSKACVFEVAEVPDEPLPDGLSETGMEAVRRREGETLWKRVRPGAYVVALDPGGIRRTNAELATRLRTAGERGKEEIVFLIGGSLGFSAEALARADERLSLSRMTFTHAWARVVLAEALRGILSP